MWGRTRQGRVVWSTGISDGECFLKGRSMKLSTSSYRSASQKREHSGNNNLHSGTVCCLYDIKPSCFSRALIISPNISIARALQPRQGHARCGVAHDLPHAVGDDGIFPQLNFFVWTARQFKLRYCCCTLLGCPCLSYHQPSG